MHITLAAHSVGFSCVVAMLWGREVEPDATGDCSSNAADIGR